MTHVRMDSLDKIVWVYVVARMKHLAIGSVVDAPVLQAGMVYPVTPLVLSDGMAPLVRYYVAVEMVTVQGLTALAPVLLVGREIFVKRVAPTEHGALIV